MAGVGPRADRNWAEKVTLDVDRGAMIVHTRSGEDVVVGVGEHRETVVRRLLDRGVSVDTLRVLLPDWDPLIDRVADGAH